MLGDGRSCLPELGVMRIIRPERTNVLRTTADAASCHLFDQENVCASSG